MKHLYFTCRKGSTFLVSKTELEFLIPQYMGIRFTYGYLASNSIAEKLYNLDIGRDVEAIRRLCYPNIFTREFILTFYNPQ